MRSGVGAVGLNCGMTRLQRLDQHGSRLMILENVEPISGGLCFVAVGLALPSDMITLKMLAFGI
jgi:hypothetical protein